jgi:vitamin B12 transporter
VDWYYPAPRNASSLSADPWHASNLAGLHFAGTDTAVDWRVSPTSQLKFSWSLLTGAKSALHGLQSEYVFDHPVNDAKAEWRWTPTHTLLLESRLGAVQRYQQTAHPVWNGSLARESGRVQPYLQMTNLSNTDYDEIQNVRMTGRSFVGGIEIAIGRKR